MKNNKILSVEQITFDTGEKKKSVNNNVFG